MNMKRVNSLLIAAFVAASAMFVGCEKDEKDPPTVNVKLDGTDRTEIVVDYSATKTSVAAVIDCKADAELKKIEFDKVGGNNISGFPLESGFTSKTFHQISHTFQAPADRSQDVIEQFTVKVTDKDNNSANKQIKITWKKDNSTPVEPEYGEINTFDNVTLGSLAHTGSSNSACASIDGNTYAVVGITAANQAKVDFIYFDGNAANNRDKSLASPTNSNVGSLSGVESWTTKNNTKLGKLSSVTVNAFDDCDDDELITTNVTATAVAADIVSQLAANDVIGFIAANGKKGLIKVISVDQSSAASNKVIIKIKVQK